MKRAILALLLIVANSVYAETGIYAEVGTYYNTDAYGITTPWVGHLSIGYSTDVEMFETNFIVQIDMRHESDMFRSRDEDLVSNEALGITIRGYIE